MRKIVSLTSYGDRLSKTLPVALKSIFAMKDFNLDMVLLYLTEDDYELLDKNLLIKYDKLSVRIVDDLKSYKKYFSLADREFDDDIVFIADDDILYHENTWNELYNLFNKYGNKNIVYVRDGRVLDKFPLASNNHFTNGVLCDKFVFWSGCGMLIPPKVMRFNEDILNAGYDVASTCDDLFFSAYCMKNNIQCCGAYQTRSELLDFNKNEKLTNVNRFNLEHNLNVCFKYFEMSVMNPIIVLLSCDNNHIKDMTDIINDILNNQTYKPDKIILSLSINDFPKKGQNLPKSLSKLQSDIFEIKWYDSIDINLIKYLPIKESEEALFVVLSCDNEYKNDFIEKMVQSYYKHDKPITNSNSFVFYPNYGHNLNIKDCVLMNKHLSLFWDKYDNNKDFNYQVVLSVLDNDYRFMKIHC